MAEDDLTFNVLDSNLQLHEVQGVEILLLRFQKAPSIERGHQSSPAYVHLTMTGLSISSFFEAVMAAKS